MICTMNKLLKITLLILIVNDLHSMNNVKSTDFPLSLTSSKLYQRRKCKHINNKQVRFSENVEIIHTPKSDLVTNLNSEQVNEDSILIDAQKNSIKIIFNFFICATLFDVVYKIFSN